MERFGQDILLLEKLAAGGMAEVYRAKQLGYGGFEKTVALKRILPHYASNEEFKAMFRLEANLSAMLQHPNIVQVFGNGDFEGYLYLLMEFVDGKNLRQSLARLDKQKGKIPIEIACHIVAEAAKGLEYAHGFMDEKTGQPMDIVHRDMSPQNIMLSYDGGVKIVDFGIAKAAARADMTKAGVLKGKFGYMSPEQAQGQKIDKRTDIFALGIILFELLTQRRLFTCDDDLRTLQLVRECKVPRPSRYNPSISPSLDRIVMKALAKERGDRYATAGELYAELLRFMNQAYPKFIPTELSKFLKQIFVEDIADERKKREKLAAEAPARLGQPTGRQEAPAKMPPQKPSRSASDEQDTAYDDDDGTELSQKSGVFEFNAVSSPAAPLNPAPGPAGPPDKTRITGEAPGDAGLPAPDAGEFSLSLPQAELDTELPPPDTTPSTFVGAPPSLRLSVPTAADYAPSAGPPPPLASTRVIRSLGIAPSSPRSKKRLFLYGTCLVFLGAFLAMNGSGTGPAEGARGPASVAAKAPEPLEPTPPPPQPPAAKVEALVPAPVAAPPADLTPPPVVAPAPTPPVVAPPPIAAAAPSPTATEVAGRRQLAGIDVNSGAKGYLTLNSIPRATEIYLNGELLRDSSGVPLQTPVERVPVRPGPQQRIRMANPVFNVQWEETVDVEEDRILSLNPTLK